MALSKNICRIYSSKKLNKDKTAWENRLSIFENVNGKDREVFFVKDSSDDLFIKKLKKALSTHELKHYSGIRRRERYSKTFSEIFTRTKDMKRVSDTLFKKIEETLKERRGEVLTQKKRQTALV